MGAVLNVELSKASVQALAAALASRMPKPEPVDDRWLTAPEAAAYLGLPSTTALHKLTAARALAFSQERAGAACYFRRSDLDAYRERSMQRPAR